MLKILKLDTNLDTKWFDILFDNTIHKWWILKVNVILF